MAKKISQLTQATQVKSDDVTVIVQDGETKKLPLNMMVTKQDIENKKVTGLAKLDEIEATYENDTYTPTIAVKNKSSVKVGEGDGVDYSANVMDGPAKSAILKGQTLVNLWNNNGEYNIAPSNSIEQKGNCFKKSTKYLLKYNVLQSNTKNLLVIQYYQDGQWVVNEPIDADINKDYYILNTPSANFNKIRLFYHSSFGTETVILKDIMLIEYKDGMENWDISYFEGMQSVKMPVLTTTGKNLFDGVLESGQLLDNNVIQSNQKKMGHSSFVPINENLNIYCSSNTDNYSIEKIYFYDKNKIQLSVNFSPSKVTTPTGAKYFRLSYVTKNWNNPLTFDEVKNDLNTQIEIGTNKTSYEPFKTNILTVNEDITLRGIGDVQDELDLLTGEMIQNIGEAVLDGNIGWSTNTNWSSGDYYSCYTKNIVNKAPGMLNIISPKYKTGRIIGNNVSVDEFIAGETGNNVIYITISKSKLTADENGNYKPSFINYLNNNPVTVQYELAQESVKTVDLIPSGTHPSTTPYCWKDGHIQLSSSGLLPSLEYSVVTSRAGQISQNATMIVKNDKRIFDLEILLAGGLVNTTYQALTLQNQVETGLSKVSLNSETEPDYLLYHMIMKLIEEKAYKLDDLTEKVSVFYLYEKLSDEQFETIYSALYPFAEDEIIEEPVVEELPEVVEDEVIM